VEWAVGGSVIDDALGQHRSDLGKRSSSEAEARLRSIFPAATAAGGAGTGAGADSDGSSAGFTTPAAVDNGGDGGDTGDEDQVLVAEATGQVRAPRSASATAPAGGREGVLGPGVGGEG
jgi:hypothetical protein